MDEQDAIEGIIASIPSKWGEHNLCNPSNPEEPLKLRTFQTELLDTQVKKKVSRIGRRSGKSIVMCIDALWYSCTHANKRVLIVAPFESQIEELFDMINKLIQYSPNIKKSITRILKKPATITLANGSIIRGMTLGAKSGESAGAAVRGRGPDRIYIDEMDYLTHQAIVAVKPFTIKKDMQLWCSSTPTGKREDFWRICIDAEKLGYKHFHYSTMDALGDEYTPEMDLEFRETYNDVEYDHEILAEFSVEMAGVFRHEDVDACLVDYKKKYGSHIPNAISKVIFKRGNRYILGIDWNKVDTVGTRLVMVEQILDKDDEDYGMFKTVFKDYISAKEYTQIKGVTTICEIYQYVKGKVADPDFQIYVDEGGGTTNIELIKKWGDENRDPRIVRILHPIDFGSKITVPDPITKQDVQKFAKPLVVNSAVHMIENHLAILPRSEDVRNGLVGQMRSYLVTNRGIGGNPTYTKHDDHDLVAFMLCCFGFLRSFSDVVNYKNTAMKIKPRQVNLPQVSKFNSVRDTEIEPNKRGLSPGETTKKPIFAKQAANAGFGYSYAGGNKDYENIMNSIDSPAGSIGVNKNSGMYKKSSIIPIKRSGPRGTITSRRIQKGYRTRGF